MAVEPGSVVIAPLGPRQLIGVAWEADRLKVEEIGDNRLRPLAGLVDVPPIAAPLRRLAEWTADYYLSPLAAVLRMVLPSSSALAGPQTMIEYRPTGDSSRPPDPAARTGARRDRRPPGHGARARRSCRGQRRGDARAGQCRRARAGRGRGRPALPRPRPRLRPARLERRAARRRRQSLTAAIGQGFDPGAARRGHRIGQDRSLFRGDRRGASPGPPGRWSCSPKSR